MQNGFGRLRLAGVALIAAAALGASVPGLALAGQSRSGAGSPAGPFVALGDSFAAGNLIPASPAGTPSVSMNRLSSSSIRSPCGCVKRPSPRLRR